MDLTFINNNSVIDNKTRSVIRRQAAKGQNLGRTITRPSRVKAFERQALVQPLFAVKSKHESSEIHQDNREGGHSPRRDIKDVLSRIEPVIGDSVSVLNLPIDVAQEDRVLMYEAVTFMNAARCLPSLAKAFGDGRVGHSLFLQLIFTDQAYYHCALATVLECNHSSPQAGVSSIRHLTQAFRLINERISRAEHVSNSTLAVVMSLSVYESTRGRYDRGMIHLSGLFRMVETRGGLDRIGSEEPEIMQKIYRADLDYALRFGATPRLNIKLFENSKAMERLNMPSAGDHSTLSLSFNPEFREQLGPELCELWKSAAEMSILVNEASANKRSKLSSSKFLRSYIWLGHRLLNYSPLNKPPSLNHLQSMAHLGLLMLVSSLLCGLNRRVVENAILSQFLRDEASLETNFETQEVLLWLLFLGAAGILQNPSHDIWLVPKTWETMQALGLDTWDSIRSVLLKFPWMNDVYESGASALFVKVIQYQSIQLSL
ncbi:hypothetical protein THAR02_02203 [Trichoderma harzianum]|uniref:Transcription factor domain-containing protein n=1 Tax=Trichoderma harzianum TaxID=5544 RepID=A0A0G0ALX4_TRIHA|nr:hypothetical protein THAR02_02203 [Trichoderma harzianum]